MTQKITVRTTIPVMVSNVTGADVITFFDIPEIQSCHDKPCSHNSHKPVNYSTSLQFPTEYKKRRENHMTKVLRFPCVLARITFYKFISDPPCSARAFSFSVFSKTYSVSDERSPLKVYPSLSNFRMSAGFSIFLSAIYLTISPRAIFA